MGGWSADFKKGFFVGAGVLADAKATSASRNNRCRNIVVCEVLTIDIRRVR